MYIIPPRIEPNLCIYPAQLNNIVYQFNLPKEVLHYIHISAIPLNPNCIPISCPTLVILCTNLPYHNEVLHYVHITLLPLNQNCVLIPCPT